MATKRKGAHQQGAHTYHGRYTSRATALTTLTSVVEKLEALKR